MSPSPGTGRRGRAGPRPGGLRAAVAAGLIAVVGHLTACGGGGGAGGSGREADGASGGDDGPPACAELTAATEDSLRTVGQGLRVKTLREGAGAGAVPGDSVVVHYTGCLPDGTRFDASRDRQRPFAFVLGEGRVIRGWELGIRGMRPGERRLLVIPPELGYGSRGSPGVIPPGSTLLFRVELLEIAGSADPVPPDTGGREARDAGEDGA